MTARGGHAVIAAAGGPRDRAGRAGRHGRPARSAGRLAPACALAGFTVVPAAEAVTSLAPAGSARAPGRLGPGGRSGLRRRCGPGPAGTGPGRGRGRPVGGGRRLRRGLPGRPRPDPPGRARALCVPLAAGMTAALAASVAQCQPARRPARRGPGRCHERRRGPAGRGRIRLSGPDATQVLVLSGTRTSSAAHAALVTTVTDWTLVAAACAGAAALVTAFGPARRRSAGPGGTADRG